MRSYPLTTMIVIATLISLLEDAMTIQVYLLLKMNELNSTFTFKKVDKEQISIAIKRLGSKKASKSNDIILRIVKEFCDISEGLFTRNFNEYLDKDF